MPGRRQRAAAGRRSQPRARAAPWPVPRDRLGGSSWPPSLRFGEGRWQQEGWGCIEVSPGTRWAAQGTLVVTSGGCAGQGGAAALLKDWLKESSRFTSRRAGINQSN